MRDERYRRLQRGAHSTGESSEAELLLARLRAGELSYEQVELAAYLGSLAAEEATDFPLDDEADLEEFAWGLCDWGHWIQHRACLAAAREAISPRLEEAFRRGLELAELCVAGKTPESSVVEEVQNALVQQNLQPLVGLEAGTVDFAEIEVSLNANHVVTGLVEVCLEEDEAIRARQAVQTLIAASRILPGGEGRLVDLLEEEFAERLLEEHLADLERVDLRARRRLADYQERRQAAPEQIRLLEERGWEYLQGQPFGDEADALQALGKQPGDCPTARARWNCGDDVVFLLVFVHLSRGARGRGGFAFNYGEGYGRVEVQTWIPAEFVSRPWFEAAMLAWSCLRRTIIVRKEKQRVGEAGLKIYLDDERRPPPGWLLVRWPEEVIALLMTCQVEALSLDHDLGDLDDERTGYTVLQWLEEQVATCDFEPPEEIAVHSANASAAAKMRRAIQSIRRFEARNQEG